jgi:hypothetical protein
VRPARFGPAMHLRNAAGADMLAPQTAQGLQREADVAHAALGFRRVLTLFEPDDNRGQAIGEKPLGVGNVGFDTGEGVVVQGSGGHGGSKHESRGPRFNV